MASSRKPPLRSPRRKLAASDPPEPSDSKSACDDPFCVRHGILRDLADKGITPELFERLLSVTVHRASEADMDRVYDSASKTAGALHAEFTKDETEPSALAHYAMNHDFRTRLMRRFLADSQEWADVISEPIAPDAMTAMFGQTLEHWLAHFAEVWNGLTETSH